MATVCTALLLLLSLASSHGLMTRASVIDAPYGSWKSPITSKAITAGSVKIGSLQILDREGTKNLLWLEGRPQEGGRYVLCRHAPDDPKKNERNAVDLTPDGTNVRTRVHEYGGAAFTLGTSGGEIYYSEFTTQCVMKLTVGKDDDATCTTPVAITSDENNRYRFADGVHDARNGRLIMVREDHTKPAPVDIVNEIVSVSTDGSGDMKVLATGNDFYVAPRLSPDGTKVAYVTWDHPNMPWDATELRVVSLSNDDASAKTVEHELVAGGDGNTSIMQPMWHPTTGELYYVSDETGYWNVHRVGLSSGPVLPMEHDFGGAAPGWQLGQQGFFFLSDGRLAATYKKEGKIRLVVADVSGEGPATDIQEYGSDDGLPMQFGNVIPGENDVLYFLGGSPSTPTSVYSWSLSKREPAKQLACSSKLSFPDDVISIPKQIEFETTLGKAFGYYYAPRNGEYKCTTDASGPPLLVKAHGGPTACTGTIFNANIQYWTSRGFAILDVDYGGSTGYGRDYRRRLRGSWGTVDVDDVCNGAKHLVKEGLADPKRLCIDGGSAGGFTTLAALAFRDVFTAGCSLYGVGDLTALARDTHKFESRYLDGLVGEYPKDENIYKERSPIDHVDSFNCPILLEQGEEDKVVPKNQAETMHDALLQKKIPTCLRMYEGEQHGFRKAENIEDALDSELAFYGRVYGIDVPDAIDIKIDNL